MLRRDYARVPSRGRLPTTAEERADFVQAGRGESYLWEIVPNLWACKPKIAACQTMWNDDRNCDESPCAEVAYADSTASGCRRSARSDRWTRGRALLRDHYRGLQAAGSTRRGWHPCW